MHMRAHAHTHTHESNVNSVTSKQEKMDTNTIIYKISFSVLGSRALKQEEMSQQKSI
jgi:hypothetical protein